jgi:hypothetical protein
MATQVKPGEKSHVLVLPAEKLRRVKIAAAATDQTMRAWFETAVDVALVAAGRTLSRKS